MIPLYKRVLNETYGLLPPAVQALHDFDDVAQFEGVCTCVRGTDPICEAIASVLRLPPTGTELPLTVSFKRQGDTEVWTRTFNGKRFVSIQWEKKSRLHERVRFITFVFFVKATEESLSLHLREMLFLGVPIKWLFRPKVKAIEFEKYGIFHMGVEASLPFFGPLVKYDAWLKRV